VDRFVTEREALSHFKGSAVPATGYSNGAVQLQNLGYQTTACSTRLKSSTGMCAVLWNRPAAALAPSLFMQ